MNLLLNETIFTKNINNSLPFRTFDANLTDRKSKMTTATASTFRMKKKINFDSNSNFTTRLNITKHSNKSSADNLTNFKSFSWRDNILNGIKTERQDKKESTEEIAEKKLYFHIKNAIRRHRLTEICKMQPKLKSNI